jgi:malonyl-CoA/methylmalonyl-CoA synthetase
LIPAPAAWERHAGRPVDPAELGAGNLPRAFHEIAVEAGEKRALTIEDESIGYRELDERAARLGAWLRARGVEPGDRVLLAGPSSVGLAAAYLGILRAEAVVVLADARASERELEHLVRDADAVAAFASGEALERLERITRAYSLEAEPPAGARLAPPDHDGSRVAVLGYTSGTTGAPKGAALSHSNLLASVRGVMLGWRWREDDVLVHALPLSHQHGLTGLQATLLAGSRAVLHASLDPARLAEAIARDRATVLFSVPAIYERLLAWDGQADFSSLRLATSGSAPLSTALFHRVADLLGQEPLERYGTTETGLDVSNPYDGPRKPGSVGLPLPGIEVALAENGEILLRGPQVFSGYWRNDDATAASFAPGGWFRTGDVGAIDPDDGYLSITGRLKELIISGGLNVYPREVEVVLEEHPSVERAAVVGLPSERWGEEVVALVVPAGGFDEEELAAHARAALAPHKRPKAILAVESLPVTSLGKLRRGALRELAERVSPQRGDAGPA